MNNQVIVYKAEDMVRAAYAQIVTDEKLEEIERQALSIVVAGEYDTKGSKQAKDALRAVTKLRTEIEKTRKEQKADYLAGGRMVDAEAKRITSRVEKIERHLQEQCKIVEMAEQRRKEQKLKDRIAKLSAVKASVMESNLAAMSDESFAEVLEAKTILYRQEMERRKREEERQRLLADRMARLKDIGEWIDPGIVSDMPEQEFDAAIEIALSNAAARKRIAEEQAAERKRIEAEQAAERQRIQEERQKLQEQQAAERKAMEDERKRIEQQRSAEIAEQEKARKAAAEELRKQQEEIQRQREEVAKQQRELQAAEQKRKDDELRKKREDEQRLAAEKAAAERKEREERERIEAEKRAALLAPLREKLAALAESVESIEIPEGIEADIQSLINHILRDCAERIINIGN